LVAVDFVPPFLPLAFQQPQAFPVSDPCNRCFRWKSVQERQQTLGAGAQRLSVEIGPYGRYLSRGARTTSRPIFFLTAVRLSPDRLPVTA
jgi:hypothetical protein